MNNNNPTPPFSTNPKSPDDVRVCTYAICKNELKFVDAWLSNIWANGHGSYYIAILDTGSTDGTYERIQARASELNIPPDRLILQQQEIAPWRFDAARNASLALVPQSQVDYCFCIDFDELVSTDFWADFKTAIFHNPTAKQIHYLYAWSHDCDGIPTCVFEYGKAHLPFGWVWYYPCHEYIVQIANGFDAYPDTHFLDSISLDPDKIYVHHYPDLTKTRASYSPLIEQRYHEHPSELQSCVYLLREYYNYYHFDKVLEVYPEILAQFEPNEPSYTDNTKLSMAYIYGIIGDSLCRMNHSTEAERFFLKALKLAPTVKECYLRLAKFYASIGRIKDGQQALSFMHDNAKPLRDWRFYDYYSEEWYEQAVTSLLIASSGEVQKGYDLLSQALNTATQRNQSHVIEHEAFNYSLQLMQNVLSSPKPTETSHGE